MVFGVESIVFHVIVCVTQDYYCMCHTQRLTLLPISAIILSVTITVQYKTGQYSTVQYSTVQYKTGQYSTVQYNTGQYSTGGQYWCSKVRTYLVSLCVFGLLAENRSDVQ